MAGIFNSKAGDTMGLASQNEIDDAVIAAKKKLNDDEILDVLKGCSCGGPMTCGVDETKMRGGIGTPFWMQARGGYLKGGDVFERSHKDHCSRV